MKKCPYCAEEIQDEAIVCRFCNRDLAPVPAAPAIPSKKRRSGPVLLISIIAVILVVVFALSKYSLTSTAPCWQQSAEYRAELISYFQEWDDASMVANSASRVTLATPISELQRLRREVSFLDHPACAENLHNEMLIYMDATIDGFLAFMQNKPDAAVNNKFDQAQTHLEKALTYLKELAPPEKP